ncbi:MULTISPECIES: flagellar filament capping protein FliD [Campylobacter]|uniref:flagellar filament capping protein FliD n=1 Tax=Campylobacter TaxID=194 RepID=UPI000A348FD3|nr:flagellar filament capping protein FliD [Campylobacter sp. P0024]MCR8679691.1 flagellar filament capping protein FliD [Campylobacter sp. RM19072]MEE3704395.1 flagellar filament capping protein FliD [Campylobacter sp. CX2-8023-23]MEE3777383.1 flagellar filament capping protein FliD [Campylobacter sp. CX2-4080-23]
MAINTEKSQLGLGSGNVLSWDTIDKLKEADTKALIKPLEKEIQSNLTKQKDLTAITTLLNTFKSSVSNLTGDNTYLKRDTKATGSGSVTVSASTGVAEQTMNLSVQQLASQDSFQSKTFGSRTDSVFSQDVSFGISIGGKDYVINADSTTTLEQLAEKINESTDKKVQAKILNVGGNEPYRLIIQSAETGEANKIEFYSITKPAGSGNTSSDTTLEALGFYFDKASNTGGTTTKDSYGNEINRLTLKDPSQLSDDQKKNAGTQILKAQDAKFQYNGIDITRSSNKVEDLILGVSLTLNKVDKPDENTNVSITQSTEGILEDLKSMVESYNSIINNINEATKYDSENKIAGTFQGVREITSIVTELNKTINGLSKDGKSLADFGVTLTKDGILKLDSSVASDMINTKFSEFKNFFSSETKFTNVTLKGDKKVEWNDEIKGKLTINGVEIDINIPKDYTAGSSSTSGTNGTGNEKDKKNALLKAIANAKNLSDVSVSFDKDGKLVIKGSGGTDIEIKGDKTFLEKLGLKEQKLDGKTEIVGGFFKELNDTLTGLIGKNGTLTAYEKNLTSSQKSLTETKERRQKELDTKYTQMAEKWVQYDSIIAKLENQSKTVKSMIEAAANANK